MVRLLPSGASVNWFGGGAYTPSRAARKGPLVLPPSAPARAESALTRTLRGVSLPTKSHRVGTSGESGDGGGPWPGAGAPGDAPADPWTQGPRTTVTREGPGRLFTGEYRHTVDAKGRLAVPSKFRAQLSGGAFVSRWLDLCLAIWPREGWERLAGKVAALPTVENPGARAFSRFVFASAVEIEFDAQGRFVLPSYLREAAGLAGEAAVVGSLDHAEIWAPGRWDDYRQALEAPDALAQHLAGLGI